MFDFENTRELPTPALVIDAKIVRHNVRRMADYAAAHGLPVRPHTKTHKSIRLAKLQVDAGAPGLTVAKGGEALAMSQVSDDLLVAFPALDRHRGPLLAELAKKATVRVAVDSQLAIESLADAARYSGSVIGILVDLDVGMGRTGVQTPQAALELAQAVDRTAGVRFDGLMIYPGHVWSKPSEQLSPLEKVAESTRATLDLFQKSGLHAAIVSGGSTPTAYQSHFVPQLTEIRPGTYIFNDLNTVRGGFCTLEDCAARIIATVVSDAVPGQIVLDAGTKTLTSDLCIPARDSGHGLIVEHPQARIAKLSEEHAQVDVTACERRPRLGDRVSIVPNHICPCVNLQDNAWWIEPNEQPVSLAIDARGKLV